MNITLTLLDPTRGAFELVPDTEPNTGKTVCTARPSRHERALTQAVLAGYGVDPSLSGSGRSEAKDWRYIKARIADYGTTMLVVRHADLLTPAMRQKLLLLAREHDVHLALTCDDITGADLGAWVLDNGGECHEESSWLTSQFSGAAAAPPVEHEDFPRHLPDGDFYVFRARCQELLDPHYFAVVDDLYRSVAIEVDANPFETKHDAADWIRARHDSHPYPAQLKTIVRAAQAAMFRHGFLLKCDLDTVLTAASDATHRRLNDSELKRLRAYRMTARPAVWALRDSGLSVTEMSGLTLDSDLSGLNLPETADTLVQAHLAYRRLEGASPTEPMFTEAERGMSNAIREAAVELGLPVPPASERRGATIASNWHAAAGIDLIPLQPRNLPGGAA